jgi:predicted hydrocarbon binding protein
MTFPPVEITERDEPDHRTMIPIANGYMRAALTAVEEVAGSKALNVMLRFSGLESVIDNLPPNNLEFDAGYVFRDYSNLNHAMVQFYGRAGKGHALRIGRRSARWMIENHPLFGFAGTIFKVMPDDQAIRISLNNTANGFRKLYKKAHFDIRINLKEEPDRFVWSSPDCPCCVGKKSNMPICWIWEAGFLEGGSFVTGGKTLHVEQVQCLAAGDQACTWHIYKKSADDES